MAIPGDAWLEICGFVNDHPTLVALQSTCKFIRYGPELAPPSSSPLSSAYPSASDLAAGKEKLARKGEIQSRNENPTKKNEQKQSTKKAPATKTKTSPSKSPPPIINVAPLDSFWKALIELAWNLPKGSLITDEHSMFSFSEYFKRRCLRSIQAAMVIDANRIRALTLGCEHISLNPIKIIWLCHLDFCLATRETSGRTQAAVQSKGNEGDNEDNDEDDEDDEGENENEDKSKDDPDDYEAIPIELDHKTLWICTYFSNVRASSVTVKGYRSERMGYDGDYMREWHLAILFPEAMAQGESSKEFLISAELDCDLLEYNKTGLPRTWKLLLQKILPNPKDSEIRERQGEAEGEREGEAGRYAYLNLDFKDEPGFGYRKYVVENEDRDQTLEEHLFYEIVWFIHRGFEEFMKLEKRFMHDFVNGNHAYGRCFWEHLFRDW